MEYSRSGGTGMQPPLGSDFYHNNYDSKRRFCSYWHQIWEIVSLNPTEVLEIGIGSSLVSQYLKDNHVNVITLDIDRTLGPDVVGSILEIPFADRSFEVVACYEVLEHLPYRDFPRALHEIYRLAKKYTIVSLPDSTRVYRLDIQIPRFGELQKLIPLPWLKAPVHGFDGHHYWEIGKKGYPLRRVIREMERTGFELEKTYRVFEMPRHRFFVLKKNHNV